MCGRLPYDFDELIEFLRDYSFRSIYELESNWNAAPTQQVPVIIFVDGMLELVPMHWGLIPSWIRFGEKPKVMPFNARSETITEKPMFRNLIRRNRCLVPASGFYEWKRPSRQPYFIHLQDEPIMLMAGLFDERREDGEAQGSCAILTCAPNDVMAEIHDRMPVIMHANDLSFWLDPEIEALGPLEHLLQPIPGDELAMHPVSTAVNSVHNNGPELIEPVAEQNTLF